MSEIKENPDLIFNGVEIFNLNFEAQQEYDKVTPIDFTVKPRVFFPEFGNRQVFSIILETTLQAQDFFVLSVSAVGKFSMKSVVSAEMQKQFIHINAVAILFPYIRAFIATLTANLGSSMGQITLPVHFFQGELEEYQPSDSTHAPPQLSDISV